IGQSAPPAYVSSRSIGGRGSYATFWQCTTYKETMSLVLEHSVRRHAACSSKPAGGTKKMILTATDQSEAIMEIGLEANRDLERRVVNYLHGRHVPGLRHLSVAADNGIVTLRGRVHSFYEKQLVQQCCQRV